jgi:5-methylcytosine-specific restriction endonuclease McrA
MARCTRTRNLEVHHKRRDGGNDLSNAEVLCEKCHIATSTYGILGKTPPEFTEETKKAALKRAGGRCECTRSGGCH